MIPTGNHPKYVFSHSVKPKKIKEKKGSIGFPKDVLFHIFSYLNKKELLSCFTVCKYWKAIASEDSLWKFLTTKETGTAMNLQEYKEYILDLTAKLFCERVATQSIKCSRFCILDETLFIQTTNYQNKAFNINTWCEENKEIQLNDSSSILTAHAVEASIANKKEQKKSTQITYAEVGQTTIVTIYSDKRVKVWNRSPVKLIWDAESMDDIKNIQIFNDYFLVLTSNFYKIDNQNGKMQLCNFQISARTISLPDQNFLVRSTPDNKINCWDIEKLSIVHTAVSEGPSITVLAMHQNILITGHKMGILKHWNLTDQLTFVKERQFRSTILCATIYKHFAFCSYQNEQGTDTCALWNLKIDTVGYLRSYLRITSIQVAGSRILLTSKNTMEIWKFKKIEKKK